MLLFSFSDKNYFSRLLFLVASSMLLSLVLSFIALWGSLLFLEQGVNSRTSTILMQWASQLGTMLLPILLLQYYDKKNTYLPLSPQFFSVQKFCFWLGFFIVSMPLMSAITDWNMHLSLPNSLSSLETLFRDLEDKANELTQLFLSDTSYFALIGNLALMAVLPAFAEEFFFRGGLQTLFSKWFKSAHLAIWVTAFIFSFIHFQFFGFVSRLALGLLLGYAFYFSRSLWTPILLHFINNGIIVIWYFLFNRQFVLISPTATEQTPSFFLLIASIVLSLLMVFYLYKSEKRSSE